LFVTIVLEGLHNLVRVNDLSGVRAAIPTSVEFLEDVRGSGGSDGSTATTGSFSELEFDDDVFDKAVLLFRDTNIESLTSEGDAGGERIGADKVLFMNFRANQSGGPTTIAADFLDISGARTSGDRDITEFTVQKFITAR